MSCFPVQAWEGVQEGGGDSSFSPSPPRDTPAKALRAFCSDTEMLRRVHQQKMGP